MGRSRISITQKNKNTVNRIVFVVLSLFVLFPSQPFTFAQNPSCQKISVSESSVDGKIRQVEWLEEQGVVFMLTMHGTLYRSGDGGKTWFNQTQALSLPHSPDSIQTVKKIIPCPSNTSHLYFLGSQSSFWKSEDGGRTFVFQLYNPPKYSLSSYPLLDIFPSPHNFSWAVTTDAGPITTLCLSQDFGLSFKLLSPYVKQFFWPPPSSPVTGIYLVVYQVYENTDLVSLRLRGLGDLIGYDSTFENYGVLLQDVFQLSVYDSTFLAVVFEGKDPDRAKLVLSTDAGFTWSPLSFDHSFQPSRALIEVVAVTRSQIYVGVTEGLDAAYNWGSLYSADFEHLIFSLSLPYITRNTYFGSGVVNVAELEGTFFANQFVVPKEEEEEEDPSGESSSSSSASSSLSSQPIRLKYQRRTLVSFNQGLDWSPLHRSNCSDTCQGDVTCSLHFPNLRDQRKFWAPDTAVGFLLGAGVEGCSAIDSGQESVYMSRDGGASWKEISESESDEDMFGLGDHGAILLLLTSLDLNTSTFRYSTDYGEGFERCSFSKTNQEIQGMFMPKSATSSSFLLTTTTPNQTHSSVIALHFSSYFSRNCSGVEVAGSEDSDYELWAPDSGSGRLCYNGATKEYSRRKSGADCFNTENYEPKISDRPCECTSEDFGCGPCYYRNEGKCMRAQGFCTQASLYQQPEPCQNTWIKPSPYEKLPDNQCEESSIELFPDEVVECSSTSSSSSTTGLITAFIVAFMVGFLISLLLFLYKMYQEKKEYHHKKVEENSEMSDL